MLTPGAPRASWSNLLNSTPVQVAGLASSALAVENVRSANFVNGTAGAGLLGAGCLVWDNVSGTWLRLSSPASTGDGSALTSQIGVGRWAFNGTTWDRERNNEETLLLASAARTVTTVTATQTNYNSRGVVLRLTVTANPGGAETLQVIIRFGLGVLLPVATFPATSAALNGVYTYFMYPGAVETIATVFQEVMALPLPRTWDVAVVHSGAGNWTYSLQGFMVR